MTRSGRETQMPMKSMRKNVLWTVLSLGVTLGMSFGCDKNKPAGPSTNSSAPNTSSASTSTPPPDCKGFPGYLHPAHLKDFYSSLPPERRDQLKKAIEAEDPTVFEGIPNEQELLESLRDFIYTALMEDSPAACGPKRSLLFPVHSHDLSPSNPAEDSIITPCLGLSNNPDPAYWFCATSKELKDFNQKNCAKPNFPGLACAPQVLSGLQVIVDGDPCYEKAKGANQPIHASTKAILKSLGHSEVMVERPYALAKCINEGGETWFVGPIEKVSSGGKDFDCHGFSTAPKSDKLECRPAAESGTEAFEVCGERFVCLEKL